MKQINTLLLLGILSFSAVGFSQDTLTISKKEIWQKASDKNLQIKMTNQDFKSAEADYRQSNALFYQVFPLRIPQFQPPIR